MILAMRQDELLKSLGRRLRLLREDRDLSQTSIAAMLSSYGVEVTPSHVSLVEKNKRKPSIEVLVGLARLLETSTDYLLMLTDDPTPAGGNDTVHYISPEADEMARTIDSLPQATRQMLMTLVMHCIQYERKRMVEEWTVLMKTIEQSVGRDRRLEIESALIREGMRPPHHLNG